LKSSRFALWLSLPILALALLACGIGPRATSTPKVPTTRPNPAVQPKSAATPAGMRSVAIASTHAYHELETATLIAGQLSDIQVDNGIDGRLVIRIVSSENERTIVGMVHESVDTLTTDETCQGPALG